MSTNFTTPAGVDGRIIGRTGVLGQRLLEFSFYSFFRYDEEELFVRFGVGKKMSEKKHLGVLQIISAVFLMSCSGPFLRMAQLPSGAMAFVRCAVPSVILGIYLGFKSLMQQSSSAPVVSQSHSAKPQKAKYALLILASLLNALRLWFFFEGYARTTMGNAVIVLNTWPIFAMLYGALLLKESLRFRDAFFLMMAFAGMVTVYSGAEFSLADGDFQGMTMLLLSAAIYSLSIVLIRQSGAGRLESTFWQNLGGTFVFLPLFLKISSEASLLSWGFAFANGFLVGVVAFSLFFSGLKRLPAAMVGHLAYCEVLFVLSWSVFVFHEPAGWRHLVGGVLIISSMVLRAELARRRTRMSS